MTAPPEYLPGEKEETPKPELVTRVLSNDVRILGSLWITNYRIIFKSSEQKYDSLVSDFSIYVSSIKSIKKWKPSDAIATKVKSFVKIVTLDFQTQLLSFPLNSGGTKRMIEIVEKIMNTAASIGVCYAIMSKENWEPFNKVYEAAWTSGLPTTEYERKGIMSINEFRISQANNRYKLTPYYPMEVPVPNSMADGQLELSAENRETGQFPVVSWRSTSTGVFIFRAGSHINEKIPDEDSVYVRAMSLKCPNQKLRVFDVQNRRNIAISKQYAAFAPEFLELPSNYHIESFFNEVLESLNVPGKDHLVTALNSNWTWILSKVMKQCSSISKLLDSGISVLIQGTRKSSLHLVVLTIVQIVVDPSYRTLVGLANLIEKEWVQFSFPFRDHYLMRDKGSMPIFEVAIHCIWMIVQANPAHFEYDEKLLSFILDHLYSTRFNNFIAASRRDLDRVRNLIGTGTETSISANATSIWSYIQCNQADFKSSSYDPKHVPFNPYADDDIPSRAPVSSAKGQDILQIDSLASLPMIWRQRFVQYDTHQLMDMYKATQSLKTCESGNTIFSLPPKQFKSLATIPLRIFQLPMLSVLHFKNAGLMHLPLEIIYAPNLEEFSVAGNPIRYLSDDWLQVVGQHLKKLRIFDMDKTNVGTLSLTIQKFVPSLVQLKVGYTERLNNLAMQIPPAIPKWPIDSKLEILELPGNGILSLPPRFVNLPEISILDLSANKLSNIPLQLECLTRLAKLDLSENIIQTIITPSGGFRMDVLVELNLSSNKLESFPEHIGNLPALRQLNLANNCLSELPSRFFIQFKALDILDLSSNRIMSIPQSIMNMKKLTYLDLKRNMLSLLPDAMIGLESIKYLDLSHNKLTSLNVCFGRMKSLVTLKISHNCMNVLPPQLGLLKDALQTFEFFGNDLTTPPLDIVRGGPKAVLDFLFDSLSGSKPIYRMKMMIVGEENVGKTTLVDQLTRRWRAGASDGFYEPIPTLSTDGIQISTCSFKWKNEGEKKNPKLEDVFDVNISWWDFAGQELYYTTHQFFLSGRSVFVVVWNLEKPLEDSRVEFWLNSIQSKIANASVVLVGTHLDALKPPQRETLDSMIKHTKLRLRMLFPTLDIMFSTASCKTGEGMVELKESLEKKIVSSKHMGEVLPASYLLLERMVLESRLTTNLPIVSKHKFLEMSLLCNISGEKELFRASKLLHNLGVLIYFEEDLVLSRYVILDPQWLAKLMSTLITTKHSFVTAGVIPHRALGHIWREFPLAMYGFLLGLLEKFEVTYNLSGFIDSESVSSSTNNNQTPLQLLPLSERNKPKKAKEKKNKLSIFSSSPSSVLPPKIQQKEWLIALIPMLKRNPDVVIGNNQARRIASLQFTSAGSRLSVMGISQSEEATRQRSITNPQGNTNAHASNTTLNNSTNAPENLAYIIGNVPSNQNSPDKYSPNVSKILERGDAAGTFDFDGVSLIPSLLPIAPPTTLVSRNMWPDIPEANEVQVTRDYLLDFVPEGLFSRLTVRLLQRFLDQTKEFVLWKEGLLLIRNDCSIYVYLTNRDEFKILRVAVRGIELQDVGSVFSAVLEANGILFKEWSRLRITQEVPCPHCLLNGISPPTYFPLEDLLDAIRDELPHLTCSIMFPAANNMPERIDEFHIPIEKLAPDMKLIYLKGNQIEYNELNIEKQIGVGGFAVVYKGQYKGETIAIKQLTVADRDPEEEQADQESGTIANADSLMESISQESYTKAFNEFRKEAFMLTDINDEHCVRMVGVCLKPFCLVTEFVACGDLYSLCHDKEPLRDISWELRLRIALDMAKGMNFLHSLKPPVIHNDLKSPNVLLASLDPDAPVVAKISDFGLSMRMSKMYTRLVDNPVWIAPEIMRGQTYDTKADVYAYGVMLWEMLERRGFFVEVAFNSELERKVMAGERPTIYNETLPEYEKLIRACWDNDPLRRPPFENIVSLLEELIVAYKKGNTKVGPSSEMLLPEAQRARRMQGITHEKPLFIPTKVEEKYQPLGDRKTAIAEEEPEEAKSRPAITEVPEPQLDLSNVVSKKVKINIAGSEKKAPSRAELLALKSQEAANANESKETLETTDPVEMTPAPLDIQEPNEVASEIPNSLPLPMTTLEKLNMLLQRGKTPSNRSNSISSATDSTDPKLSSSPNSPSTAVPSATPEINTEATPTSPYTAPVINKKHFMVRNEVMSLKSALNVGISSIASSLQNLTDATSEVELEPFKFNNPILDTTSREVPNVISPRINVSDKLAITNLNSIPSNNTPATSLSIDTAAVPAISSSNSPRRLAENSPALLSPTLSSTTSPPNLTTPSPVSATGLSPSIYQQPSKNILISLEDANQKLSDLSDGLSQLLKFTLSISSALRNQDLTTCQTHLLDSIKFLRTFRESAGIPAGLITWDSSTNSKLKLLKDSLKTLFTQALSLIQIARLILKQDEQASMSDFTTAASSFVASFKITTGVLEMIKLEGQKVLEYEIVDFTS